MNLGYDRERVVIYLDLVVINASGMFKLIVLTVFLKKTSFTNINWSKYIFFVKHQSILETS